MTETWVDEWAGSRQYRIGHGIFMAGAYAMLALMLAMFVSALLAGGQFGRDDDIKWDVWIPWPAIWIPSWLVISLSVLPPIGALVLAPAARWQQGSHFIPMIGQTVVTFGLLPVAFSVMYTESGGPSAGGGVPEAGWSSHWIAALPQVVTVLVLLVRLIMLAPAYNAARRSALEALR